MAKGKRRPTNPPKPRKPPSRCSSGRRNGRPVSRAPQGSRPQRQRAAWHQDHRIQKCYADLLTSAYRMVLDAGQRSASDWGHGTIRLILWVLGRVLDLNS